MSQKSRASARTVEAHNALWTLLRAVRKNWPLVAAITTLFFGGSFVYSKSLPRIYDATALIELNATVTRPLAGTEKSEELMQMGGEGWWDSQEYYETQYRIVTTRAVLLPVARDLRLGADDDFMGRKLPAASSTPDQAVNVLASHVRVEPVKNSRLFVLHVEDTDPKRAKRICQAVASTYIDQNLQTAINETSDAATWLSTQLDHLKLELEADENALYEFKKDNELPSTSINEASNMLRLEMQSYTEALARTRTKKEELAARYAELAKIPSDDPGQIAASELLNNTYLSKLRSDYEDSRREHQGLLAEGKGESHPLVRASDQRGAQTKRELLAEVDNIKHAVGHDLAIVEREETGTDGLYQSARRRAVDLNMKEIEYHRLDRAREQNEKLYGILLQRMKEADLARMMRVNNIHLAEAPIEPIQPVRPRIGLNTFVGLLLGLGLGIALAYGREIIDNSLKTPEDVEQALEQTFLGLLPEVDEGEGERPGRRRRRNRAPKPTENPELIVHERPGSGIAEAARTLRTNLMFMNPDHPYRTMLVTSAAPSEGKTTVACSIAIAFAQSGKRVCVVDCDLRRPRLHRIFGRVGEAGVTNVLVGDATVTDVAQPTIVDNLWCIPAGPNPPNPADMLHSARFKKFLAELGEHFDKVIIDSPPLVAVTDSAIVSTLVDGTVFVVRAFKTARPLARQGLRALADVDSPVIGVVLNAVNLNRHEYTYYHYYYYKREGYAPVKAAGPVDDAVAEEARN